MNKQSIGELEHTEKFIPELEEIYYFIDGFGVAEHYCYRGDSIDERIIKHSLVFRERRDCRIYGQYLKLLNEYTFEPDWKDLSQDKYYLAYDAELDKVRADITHRYKISSYYFETLDELNEFIEKAGELNIKRFMFDIWEEA